MSNQNQIYCGVVQNDNICVTVQILTDQTAFRIVEKKITNQQKC